MNTKNPFIKDNNEYERRLDILGIAVEDSAHFLAIKSGMSFDDCYRFVSNSITKGGVLAIERKKARVTKRLENGDRVKDELYVDELLDYVKSNNAILSPNMVVYDNPIKNRSFLSKFIDDRMQLRKVVKKRGQEAKQGGNDALAVFCENQQTTIKTLINSLSGAHASPHNPHYNKTAHSTLCSITRIATSYSNATTEKLLSGNRHYWNFEITINNIVSITRNTDYLMLAKVMDKYDLTIPTHTDVIESIKKSSTLMYWNDVKKMKEIEDLVSKLNPLQRAAFLYTGDLFNIAQLNESFMRNFLTELITSPTILVDNPDEILQAAGDDIISLCGILCQDILSGKKVKDLKVENLNGYITYASTINHVKKTIEKYADFIVVFLATSNLPTNIYSIPTIIRKVVVGSDTDSTMFTTQDWVEWYCGKIDISKVGQSISAALMYINTQCIIHTLAMISRQIGVEEKNLFRLKMKNEFSFLVYMVANRSKHYITMINAREGNIYAEPEIEIKGVALKDSKNPPIIMHTLEQLIKNGMNTLRNGETIEIYPILQRIANIEHSILNSLESGSIQYLSMARVNTKEAYKLPMQSNYAHYDFWQNVFALKYGAVGDPPLTCIKISGTLDTANKFNEWVNTLDPTLASAVREWQGINNKKYLGQFILPLDKCIDGIPKEFISSIDKRGIIRELMQGYYIYLEILGMYMRNINTTRLVSDDIPYRPELGIFLVE